MSGQDIFSQQVSQVSTLATNKVIKNTYLLLSMTLAWSALLAVIAMSITPPVGIGLFCSIGALIILWFVMPKVERSAAALPWVFAFTGLLGFGLGPTLNYYTVAHPGVVSSALSITAATFLGLSGYAIASKKDFSFMGGFLAAGIMVAFFTGIGALIASLFGFYYPPLMLAVSAAFALLSAGLILYQTSLIINGGETNYISATVTLYVAIYNLFTSLLHILGVMGDD